jgi:hypothetical protein
LKSALLFTLSTVLALIAGPLGGPVPGYILDSRSNSIRPVLGIPGGMQLGTPVTLPFGVLSADFSADGQFAIAISNETPGHIYLIRNFTSPVLTDLGPVPDASSVLGVNSRGTAAVLSSPGQLQFMTSIADTPVLSAAVPTNNLLGPITAGVVDDAGQCAVLATAGDGSGAIETLCADGSSQRILTQTGLAVSSLALANNGGDAIVADTAGQQILRISGYAQSPAVTAIATSADQISAPVGVQILGDQAFVADSAASALFLIDLAGHNPVQATPLSSPPARLKFLADRSILLLTDTTAAPFTIFNLPAMQSYFVPAN